MSGIITLIIVTGAMFAVFIIISTVGNYYSLNRIMDKTIGQGQHEQLGGRPKKRYETPTSKLIFSRLNGEQIPTAGLRNKA